MSVLPLGDRCGPFCYSSAPARFVFGLLCEPRSPLNSSPPVLDSTSPPLFPPRPLPTAQMYFFYTIKRMILQSRLFANSAL